MKIAISLIWIRHKVAGGVESFTRNILDGFVKNDSANTYILLCSKDNIESFRHYSNDSRFIVYECPVFSFNLKDTIFFENFKLDSLISSLKADVCFIPSFRMPLLYKKNKYIVVIHDLISSNMPHLFKWYRRLWLNTASKRAWKRADRVITISNFVARDLSERFGPTNNNTIYNPILPDKEATEFRLIEEKYYVSKGMYFYTVSSLAKNKNLFTLLKMMKILSTYEQYKDYKLIISGVGFAKSSNYKFDAELFLNYIDRNNLKDRCVFTGFVTNEERNSLIINSKFFLFPSIFEGFGMPVVEALELGSNVITTKCASIPEVSQGRAIYVENPYDENDWIKTISNHWFDLAQSVHFAEYEIGNVTDKYLNVFSDVIGTNTSVPLKLGRY